MTSRLLIALVVMVSGTAAMAATKILTPGMSYTAGNTEVKCVSEGGVGQDRQAASLCVCREGTTLFSGGRTIVQLQKYNSTTKTYDILKKVKGETLEIQKKRCAEMADSEPACFYH